MNSEEEKRVRVLLRKEDGPLNTYPFDPKTSSVQPSTEHPQTPVPYAGGTSSGRGNDPSRSSGARMPPPVVGLQLPEPGQLGGSNTPQSSIKQLGPAISQQPGQVIPAVSNPYQIPKELQKKPGPEYTGRDAINPFLNGEFGAYKPSGCGNVDNPPLHPRTASGKNANPGPGDVSDSGIGQQVKTPIVTQERS